MKTALRYTEDPVIFLESKSLFNAVDDIPVGEEYIPFGVARLARPGKDITVVACGAHVHTVLAVAGILASESAIECEVVDLRTVVPLDTETVIDSGKC